MIKKSLISLMYEAASIQRWNDHIRPWTGFTELDKQAHKMFYAYVLAKCEGESVNMIKLIEGGIFEFFHRIVLTDIKPPIYHKLVKEKGFQIDNWVLSELEEHMDEDNFPAKFLINDACVLEKKPFSHAGIIRFKGQLMTYVPGQGPCYRCVFKNPPPKDAVPTCKQAGVIGAMGGVIGSLQAMEAIKYLIGVGDLLTGSLLTFDALTMEFHKIKLPKDTHKCPVCGDNPTILEPIDYEQEVCEETAGRFATRDEQ